MADELAAHSARARASRSCLQCARSHPLAWAPTVMVVATRACWTCYAVCGEDHAPDCETALAIREQYASLQDMTHVSDSGRIPPLPLRPPVEGTLSAVPGAQSYTRSRSLDGMKKAELIERVLLVEEHCRFIDAQLHEAWQENRRLRRDSQAGDIGHSLSPRDREELEDLRFRMRGLEK